MQFLTILSLTTLTGLALAAPATSPNPLVARDVFVCSGTSSTPQCCATNVLDLADLNCNNPPSTPTDAQNFIDICSAIGQQAQCCVLPILGQALICDAPLG